MNLIDKKCVRKDISLVDLLFLPTTKNTLPTVVLNGLQNIILEFCTSRFYTQYEIRFRIVLITIIYCST